MKIRLNRYLSVSGVASRRKSEDLIKSSKVKVNGDVVTSLATIVDTNTDKIECEDKVIKPQQYEYYKMNKPRFYLTSMSKDENKKTILELLPTSKTKLFPIGRLDYDTEGLLLFTNDGVMAHHIAHPSFNVKKNYLAYIEGKITRSIVLKMRKGAKMKEGLLVPERLVLRKAQNNDSLLEIEIHEGRNHIVKHFFKFFGKQVKKLKRISVGPINLGKLPPGKIEKLDYNELEALLKLVSK